LQSETMSFRKVCSTCVYYESIGTECHAMLDTKSAILPHYLGPRPQARLKDLWILRADKVGRSQRQGTLRTAPRGALPSAKRSTQPPVPPKWPFG